MPHVGNGSSCCYSYTAKGGTKVEIPKVIDMHAVLGIKKGTKEAEIKAAFRQRIKCNDRQQRAIVSYAKHMLSPLTKERYNSSKSANAFDYAISGHTQSLGMHLDRNASLLNAEDPSGRTLLYIAARSGFYDTCEYLLKRGAMQKGCGRDRSTPLHAASFYGHPLVCSLLVQYGADLAASNVWGNTPVDEACDGSTRRKLEQCGLDALAVVIRDTRSLLDSSLPLPEIVTDSHGNAIAYRLHHRSNRPPKGWLPSWHGTKAQYVRSILRNGLKAAGSTVDGTVITPPKGHYELGSTHFGVKNWAAAVFVSPSLLYAGHPCYSERIVKSGRQWCVLVRTHVRPGTFGEYDSTVLNTDPVDGEPAQPEWRVDVEGDDLIWRQRDEGSVMVTTALFVDLEFFDRIGLDGGPTYREATDMLSAPPSKQ